MKCTKCGSELKEGQKFCMKCGTPVLPQPQRPMPPQPNKSVMTNQPQMPRPIQPQVPQPPRPQMPQVPSMKQPQMSPQPKSPMAPQPQTPQAPRPPMPQAPQPSQQPIGNADEKGFFSRVGAGIASAVTGGSFSQGYDRQRNQENTNEALIQGGVFNIDKDTLKWNKNADVWRAKFEQVLMKGRSLRGDSEFTRQLDYYENSLKK